MLTCIIIVFNIIIFYIIFRLISYSLHCKTILIIFYKQSAHDHSERNLVLGAGEAGWNFYGSRIGRPEAGGPQKCAQKTCKDMLVVSKNGQWCKFVLKRDFRKTSEKFVPSQESSQNILFSAYIATLRKIP